MRLPNTSHELIELLDRTFPEPAIGPNDTMDEIKFKAGQRSVIAFAKQLRDSASKKPVAPAQRGAGRPTH